MDIINLVKDVLLKNKVEMVNELKWIRKENFCDILRLINFEMHDRFSLVMYPQEYTSDQIDCKCGKNHESYKVFGEAITEKIYKLVWEYDNDFDFYYDIVNEVWKWLAECLNEAGALALDVVIFGNEHDKLEYYNLRDNRPCTSDDYDLLEELDEWIEVDNEELD